MADQSSPSIYRFWPAKPGGRLAILAACIASQQKAGFKDLLDIREEHCPTCSSSGFNTGWGVWSFACGFEVHSDGEPCAPCPHEQPDDGAGHGTASTTDASKSPRDEPKPALTSPTGGV